MNLKDSLRVVDYCNKLFHVSRRKKFSSTFSSIRSNILDVTDIRMVRTLKSQ